MNSLFSRYISFVIVLLLILSGCSVAGLHNHTKRGIETTTNEFKLVVNGVDITTNDNVEIINDKTRFGDDDANISFVSVMEELGAEFKWETPRKAKMYYNGAEYDLDVDAVSLENKDTHVVGNKYILIEMFYNAERVEARDYDIILDAVVLNYALEYINQNLNVDVNREAKTVNVYEMDFSNQEGYKLIVEGKELKSDAFKWVAKHEAYIPFVAVMEELGAEFEWETARKAKMLFEGVSYELDIDEESIVEEGGVGNWFTIVGCSIAYENKKMDYEFSVFYGLARTFLQKEKENTIIRISPDYRTKTINIYREESNT